MAVSYVKPEITRSRSRSPRLPPEIWSPILYTVCWSLASFARTTTLNREVWATYYAPSRAKCTFLLAISRKDPDRAMALLVKCPQLPDVIDCLLFFVGCGAVYQCRGRHAGVARRQHWRDCLLHGLLKRKDAVAAVTACLSDDTLGRGMKFNVIHRRLAVWHLVEDHDVTKIGALLTGPGAPEQLVKGMWWENVIKMSDDARVAREFAAMLRLPMRGFTADIRNGLTECFRRGGEFVWLAFEVLWETVPREAPRELWANVDLLGEVLKRRRGARRQIWPDRDPVWCYLYKSFPERAADDALLMELLAGEYRPSALAEIPRGTFSHLRDVLSRPQLMQDLIDIGFLVHNYLDIAIDRLVRDRKMKSNDASKDAATLELIDAILDAGGAVLPSCVTHVMHYEHSGAFIAALIDRVPEGSRAETIIEALDLSHSVARRREILSYLLGKSYPVTLEVLDAAIRTPVRKTLEHMEVAGLVREVLEHADVPVLVAQDVESRAAGDSRLIAKAIEPLIEVTGEGSRILPVVRLLVDAGFRALVGDAESALSRGWVQTSVVLKEAAEKQPLGE